MPKRAPEGAKTASKSDAELAPKKYQKTHPKILQNSIQNGARGAPKSSPGAPEGTPRAAGPPWDLPSTLRELILAAPELSGTILSQFWQMFDPRRQSF